MTTLHPRQDITGIVHRFDDDGTLFVGYAIGHKYATAIMAAYRYPEGAWQIGETVLFDRIVGDAGFNWALNVRRPVRH